MIWAAQKGLPKFSFLRNRNKQLMSDGNFNRQLLPKTDLSSGLRAGKAQMRQKAERAFDEVVNDFILNEGELKEAMKKRFLELLRK